jgi:hypothetical protein
MIDGRRRASFAKETSSRFFVADEFSRKRFYCNGAIELGVFGFVDHTHSAFADLFQDAVVEYGFTDH